MFTATVCLVAVAMSASHASGQQRSRSYGGNFGWGYSTPRTTYYNGPSFGYGGGGGNVQYFQRGRNALWFETYRDSNGRLRQRSGQFYYGGR